jgi:hypothetical protein
MAQRAVHVALRKTSSVQLIALGAGCFVVGLAYVLTEILAGMVLAGERVTPVDQTSEYQLARLVMSGMAVGLCIGPVAAHVHTSLPRHVVIWATLIFLNFAAVLVEGSFFAPELVNRPATLLLQQLVAATVTAFVIGALVGGAETCDRARLGGRPLRSWMWRFALSSVSYVAPLTIPRAVCTAAPRWPR